MWRGMLIRGCRVEVLIIEKGMFACFGRVGLSGSSIWNCEKAGLSCS